MQRVTVNEVLGRAVQGRTQPFICRCDDGFTYYVKGRSAGRAGLVSELICARLAELIELPVPDTIIAVVPDELIAGSHEAGLRLDDLGAGPCFGSRLVQAVEFTMAHQERLSLEAEAMCAGIVVFDWWVRNEDRTLTSKGGNVNLLWRVEDEGVAVIDHNLAFDQGFDPERFLETHVFADHLRGVAGDFEWRQAWKEILEGILPEWDTICASIPEEWQYIDPEQTIPANLNLEAHRQQLERCKEVSFWTLGT